MSSLKNALRSASISLNIAHKSYDTCENEHDSYGAYTYWNEIEHLEAKIESLLGEILGYPVEALDGERRPKDCELLTTKGIPFNFHWQAV